MPAFSLLAELDETLGPSGIVTRGVAQFGEGEGPDIGNGRNARSVVLLGNVGSSVWPAFSRWRGEQPDGGGRNPLDNWSRKVIGVIAGQFGAHCWFPSDPPYMPFQTWARMAEGLEASPLGILIHPEFGLWHGYRGALGFAERIDAPVAEVPVSPCRACLDKPCLTTCPADAVAMNEFDVRSCRTHLASEAGRAGCMSGGCAARNACPVGNSHRYCDDQLRFHMEALFH